MLSSFTLSLLAVVVGPCASFAPLHYAALREPQRRGIAKNTRLATLEVPSEKEKSFVDEIIDLSWDLDAKVEKWISKNGRSSEFDDVFDSLRGGVSVSSTPTLGDTFPNLVGSTQSTDSFDLYEYLGDNWGVVFMHPGECQLASTYVSDAIFTSFCEPHPFVAGFCRCH